MKIRQRDGSGTRDYKYVIADLDRHCKVRLYFRRRPEPKVLLREAPGTPAFDREYFLAYAGEPAPPVAAAVGVSLRLGPALGGSLRWLVEQYYESAVFKKLDDSTRQVRRRILDAVCERTLKGDPRRLGDLPFAGMEPHHIAKLRDEKADTPEAANSYVKAMRAVFQWGCHPEYQLATRNPAKDVGYLEADNPDGHRTWTEAEVARYEAAYPLGTKARVAFDLFQYTGARISDVVRLGPQMERADPQWGWVLVFSEWKGRARAVKTHEMPILPALRASIDAYRAGEGQGGQHLVYLPTTFGKPHSTKGFGNWFVDQVRRAGLEQGSRRTACARSRRCALPRQARPSISSWRGSAGRRRSRPAPTPARPIGRGLRAARPRRYCNWRNRTRAIPGTKSPPFRAKWSNLLPGWRPVGPLERKSPEYQWANSAMEAGSGIEPLYTDLQSVA
jgi:integrase